MTSPSRAGAPRLKWLGVGAGRDGTLSLTMNIRELFEHKEGRRIVYHEYGANSFYQHFCDYAETKSTHSLAEIDRLIRACPADCIIGNGYAFVLDRIVRLGGDIKLLHIQRQSIDDWLNSIMTDARDFPQSYRYYVSDDPSHSKRIAAFHFGEMSRAEWGRLSLEEKFRWYYQKTHRLITDQKQMFSDYVHLRTEDISSESGRRTIAQFVGSDHLPPPVHANKNVAGIEGMSPPERAMLQWYFRSIDYYKIARGPHEPVSHFLGHLSRWLYYQAENGGTEELYWAQKVPQRDLHKIVVDTEGLLAASLKEIQDLKKRTWGDEPVRDTEINRLAGELAMRSTEIGYYKSEMEVLKRWLGEQQTEMGSLTEELGRVREVLRFTETVVAQRGAELAQQAEAFRAIQESMSWRLTAPFRRMMLMLSRVARGWPSANDGIAERRESK